MPSALRERPGGEWDGRGVRGAGEDFPTLAEFLQGPRLAALARDFEAAAPGAAALARFDTFFGRLLEKLRSQAERADSQVAAFRRTVPEIEAQVEAQSADLVMLRQLQREAEATRLIYEYFLGRMKEISVQEGIQQADSRVLSPAKIPTVTSYPKIRQTIIRGGFIGLIVSILLIYGRNALRTTIRTPEELEAATGLTVMGIIPNAPVRNARALLDYMVKKPASGAAEAVRNLRTAILLSNVDSVPQVIMVTSSVPDEGKTVMAAVLAQTSVMSGKRVLLIDGDLRRRALTKQFDVGSNHGVVALLGATASFQPAGRHRSRRPRAGGSEAPAPAGTGGAQGQCLDRRARSDVRSRRARRRGGRGAGLAHDRRPARHAPQARSPLRARLRRARGGRGGPIGDRRRLAAAIERRLGRARFVGPQEPGSFQADLAEGRVHGRPNAGHAAQEDGADHAAPVPPLAGPPAQGPARSHGDSDWPTAGLTKAVPTSIHSPISSTKCMKFSLSSLTTICPFSPGSPYFLINPFFVSSIALSLSFSLIASLAIS